MTKIIAFVQQKGGTGKTTLCDQTAFNLHELGHAVLVTDLDDQQGSRFHKKVEEPAGDPDYLLVDTRGSLDLNLRSPVSIGEIIKEADFVIIPTLLESDCIKPLRLVSELCILNNTRYLIVCNMVDPGNLLIDRALFTLFKDTYGDCLSDILVHRSTLVSQSRQLNSSLTDTAPRARVTKEMKMLTELILKELS